MSYDEKRDKLDELERLAKEAGFETLRLIGWNAPLRLTLRRVPVRVVEQVG